MFSKVKRNQKLKIDFCKQLSRIQILKLSLAILSITVLSIGCKKKEKFYTEAEAIRIADSAAWAYLKPKLEEMEKNFELRKRVELPHYLGIKNPYVEQAEYELIIPHLENLDSNIIPEEVPDSFKKIDSTEWK